MCFQQEQEIVQLRKEIEILQDPTKFQALSLIHISEPTRR